jgi:hypothetical protein
MKCKKCGETLLRLMFLALAEDAGAGVYPSATECFAGGEHDFVEEEVTEPEKGLPIAKRFDRSYRTKIGEDDC